MGTDISYRIMKKNKDTDNSWEEVNIDNIPYEIERCYPLFALLADQYNEFNILSIKSEYVDHDSYGNGDNIIYLNDMLSYNWDARFAYNLYLTEKQYLNHYPVDWAPRNMLIRNDFGLANNVVYDEPEYWEYVNINGVGSIPHDKFFIKIVKSFSYIEYFKDFYEHIIGFMKTLDTEPRNVMFVCNFYY